MGVHLQGQEGIKMVMVINIKSHRVGKEERKLGGNQS